MPNPYEPATKAQLTRLNLLAKKWGMQPVGRDLSYQEADDAIRVLSDFRGRTKPSEVQYADLQPNTTLKNWHPFYGRRPKG
jgi:hypothetical protein